MSAAAPEHPRPWGRVLAVLGVFAAVALLSTLDVVQRPLAELLAVTERMIAARPIAGAALFVVFAALSGMLAFFSSAMIVPVAVHAWGPARSAALLWFGWMAGGALTYAIGRFLGRPVVERLAPKGVIARYIDKASHDTPVGLVVLFQLAMPSEVPGYLLGLVRYSFVRYFAVVAAAELPYAIGTVVLGESFVEQRVLPFVILGALAAGLSGWAYVRLHRRLATHEAAAAARAPGAG
jgi:uncharacterized membrane protein YdjX (TVP38/TMEM64 family)